MTPLDANARAQNGERPHDPEQGAGPAVEPIRLTETGNAERFARDFRDFVRYVTEHAEWIIWDGKVWIRDPGNILVQAKIKQSHLRLYGVAEGCADDRERSEIAKFAKSSERRASRESTEKLARSETGIAIGHQQLDVDPMLLNAPNGTIELATGKLRQHRRGDMITRMISVPYSSSAACPRWLTFLGEILPDEATVAYVQRAVGYSLTGMTTMHCMFVLWGLGANGKSTLLRVLLDLLGPYAAEAPPDLLLARRGDAHPTEITELHGRRLVVAAETDENRRWAEATVKQLTGGDRLTARRMRQDFWEFTPTHKLWMATNHRPEVRGQDEGIWRRLKLIKFDRVIPPERRNPNLSEELRAELPGILRWAVDGCLTWQRDGIEEPAAVTEAVADYRADEDHLGPFLEERCVLEVGARVSRAELRKAYEAWVVASGEGKPQSPKEFAGQLRQRGFSNAKAGSGRASVRAWAGLRLREQDE